MDGSTDPVTGIVRRLDAGDSEAVGELFQLVYDELHHLARRQRWRWRDDATLNTTALVHEAYLKLVGQERISVGGRTHFFALAARAMRHILSNYAEQQRAAKRGGGGKLSLDAIGEEGLDAAGGSALPAQPELYLALDEALERLEMVSERQARIVECRFYGGMSVEETALALGVSTPTVKRDWAVARAWLYRELRGEPEAGPAG